MGWPFFMAKSLAEIERDWFVKKVGARAPIDELKKRYWKSQNAVGYSVTELESSWLGIAITAKSGTPSSDYPSDLWKQLNRLEGFKVCKTYDENRMVYYLNKP
jgi:hypothetical protein